MSKKLIAYFSASGTTKKVAEMISEAAGADLYEIKPKELYTKADLDWMNKKSRSSVEMSDKKLRPELDDSNAHIENYDEIVLGFPIWWYVAPTIINTFLEKYDFTGKKITLFATSGGSGFGNTIKELQPSAPGADLLLRYILHLPRTLPQSSILPDCWPGSRVPVFYKSFSFSLFLSTQRHAIPHGQDHCLQFGMMF